MTPSEERRFLRRIDKRLDARPRSPTVQLLIRLGAWLLLVLVFFLLMQLDREGFPLVAQLFISALAGAAIMLMILKTQASKAWPVLSRFISREDLRKRLEDLRDV